MSAEQKKFLCIDRYDNIWFEGDDRETGPVLCAEGTSSDIAMLETVLENAEKILLDVEKYNLLIDGEDYTQSVQFWN